MSIKRHLLKHRTAERTEALPPEVGPSKISQETAMEALCWLTGSRRPIAALKTMIGADNFGVIDNTVQFHFKAGRSINYFVLEYDYGMDLWNAVFKFFRHTGPGTQTVFKEIKRVDGLYCDQLKEVFEETTGLRLTVPRIIGINA